MEIPKFLMGDNTDFPEDIFVIHTEFPRFVINLRNDEIHWLEEFDREDEKEILNETHNMIKAASDFYDREVANYQD